MNSANWGNESPEEGRLEQGCPTLSVKNQTGNISGFVDYMGSAAKPRPCRYSIKAATRYRVGLAALQ